MLELFRDPVWQFIGAAVTFLFGLVAAAQWILQFRQRTKKSFCWEIRRVPLFRHREDTKGRLKVLFDGTSIRDADIVLIRLLN